MQTTLNQVADETSLAEKKKESFPNILYHRQYDSAYENIHDYTRHRMQSRKGYE